MHAGGPHHRRAAISPPSASFLLSHQPGSIPWSLAHSGCSFATPNGVARAGVTLGRDRIHGPHPPLPARLQSIILRVSRRQPKICERLSATCVRLLLVSKRNGQTPRAGPARPRSARGWGGGTLRRPLGVLGAGQGRRVGARSGPSAARSRLRTGLALCLCVFCTLPGQGIVHDVLFLHVWLPSPPPRFQGSSTSQPESEHRSSLWPNDMSPVADGSPFVHLFILSPDGILVVAAVWRPRMRPRGRTVGNDFPCGHVFALLLHLSPQERDFWAVR